MAIKWVDLSDNSFQHGLYRFNTNKTVVEISLSKWNDLTEDQKKFYRDEILDDEYLKAL